MLFGVAPESFILKDERFRRDAAKKRSPRRMKQLPIPQAARNDLR